MYKLSLSALRRYIAGSRCLSALLSFQLQQNGRQLAKVSEGRIWFRTGARWNTALVINPNRRHTCLLRTEHVNIEAITDERSLRR